MEIEQLRAWVEGNLTHKEGEHLPDCSCCIPELLAPKEERELFLELFLNDNYQEYEKMMGMFLGRALPLLTDKKVYLSGGKP